MNSYKLHQRVIIDKGLRTERSGQVTGAGSMVVLGEIRHMLLIGLDDGFYGGDSAGGYISTLVVHPDSVTPALD